MTTFDNIQAAIGKGYTWHVVSDDGQVNSFDENDDISEGMFAAEKYAADAANRGTNGYIINEAEAQLRQAW